MSTASAPTALDQVVAALERGAPVDDVLDLVDRAIERATAEGSVTTLVRLAELLGEASLTRADGRGLAIAATRARAEAAAIPAIPAMQPPPELDLDGARARPHEPRLDIRYAGWWRRVAAFVVDWVVLFTVMGVVPGESDGALLVSVFVLPIAYFAGLHAYGHGRTIGKWIAGIAVRRSDGAPVDLPHALGRAAVQCLLWLTVIGGIVDSLLPLGDERHRTIHDRAAATVVVRVR